MDATEAQLEHEAVEVLRAAGARFAFVFGSVAEGRSTPASDLDVAAWWGEEAPASWDPRPPARAELLLSAAGAGWAVREPWFRRPTRW